LNLTLLQLLLTGPAASAAFARALVAPPELPPIDFHLHGASAAKAEDAPSAGTIDYQIHIDFPDAADHKPVPFEIVHGVLLFRAKLDGLDVWAMLDNGSSSTLVDTGFILSRGLKLGPQLGEFRTPTGTMQRWRAPELRIVVPGEMTADGALFAADLSPWSRLMGRSVSLVLGKEFFDNLAFLIRPAEQNFELGSSGSFNPNRETQEIVLKNDRPELNAVVDGQPLVLTIDIGDGDMVSLSSAAWARLRLNDALSLESRTANFNAQMHSTKKTFGVRMKIGRIVTQNVVVSRAPQVSGDSDGRLGLGFLKHFTFAIDVKKRRLWLVPPARMLSP
jgi:hypothetical protein